MRIQAETGLRGAPFRGINEIVALHKATRISVGGKTV